MYRQLPYSSFVFTTNRKRGTTMPCHEGAGTSLLSRLWWGVAETSPDQLTARVRSWLSTISPVLLPLRDRRAVADFVSGFGATYRRTDVYPEAEFGRMKTAIALRALEDDVDWVRNALRSPELSIDYEGRQTRPARWTGNSSAILMRLWRRRRLRFRTDPVERPCRVRQPQQPAPLRRREGEHAGTGRRGRRLELCRANVRLCQVCAPKPRLSAGGSRFCPCWR
jgi:hypothetical protein